MRTAAVVTVTNGKRPEQLARCMNSVSDQTYKVASHYVLFDDKDEFDWCSTYIKNPGFVPCYWGKPIGGNGWAGQRWLEIGRAHV